MNLLKNCYVSLAMAGTSGGSTGAVSAVIDTADCEGVMFVAFNSTIGTTDFGIWANMGTSSGLSSTASSIAGSAVYTTSAATDVAVALDVYKPQRRYVQAVVNTPATGSIGGVVAIKYGLRKGPTTQSTATGFLVINSEVSVSASSGTV